MTYNNKRKHNSCKCKDNPPIDINGRCVDCELPVPASRATGRKSIEDDSSYVQPGDPDWLEEYSRSDADPGL